MIDFIEPPKLWTPERPAIIRPGVDLAKYFPVDLDRHSHKAIVSELIKTGRVEKGAIPFGMFIQTGPLGPLTKTYVNTYTPTPSGSGATQVAASIGTASSDRLVLLFVTVSADSNVTISSVTIGGVSTNNVQSSGSNQICSSVRSLNVTGGTTADIVVTASGTITGAAITVVTLTGWLSSTPIDVDQVTSSSGTGSNRNNDLLADSVGFWIEAHKNTNASSFTGTGISAYYDAAVASIFRHSVHHYSTTSAETKNLAASWTGSAPRAMVSAAFK